MSRTQEMAQAVQQQLADAFRDHRVQVTATDSGTEHLAALPDGWIAAAASALVLAHPTRRLELLVTKTTVEPMPEGGAVHVGLAGGAFVQDDGVARITLEPSHVSDDVAVGRHLWIPSRSLLVEDGAYTFFPLTSPVRKAIGTVYSTAYDRAPLALDTWRQWRNQRRSVAKDPMVVKASGMAGAGDVRPTLGQGRPTVWVAMHWLEAGGAESWAFDAAEAARDAGFEVVITVDRSAPQRALARALAITPHVFLAANALANEDWGRFLRAVLARFDVVALHIHHSARLYAWLPELRHLRPEVVVLDSTHIVEHRSGGFVRQSVAYSHLIDQHHVISPELRDLYILDSHVRPDKVAYHPLTHGQKRIADHARVEAAGHPATPLRIGFLGRIAPQKRPFLFIEVVRRLTRGPRADRFAFVMQGSGPLEGMLDRQIARSGVGNRLERRAWGPAATLLADVDVLCVSSDNEGLTLTSLEADEAGVLVVSADVGSQRSLVAPEALLPATPHAFLRAATHLLDRLADEPGLFARLRAEQGELVASLRRERDAESYYTDFLTELKGRP
ncbi:glycosyltransferase [Arsenicicoccus bolidensis]|uniref:Glycosyltransferase n=1 Tax=Arsenicicoccus bolidensis TaxID=229480 RepID=A0ABS9Q2E9_9MICO|nr:glycosyltransferase [Arsenicicoccus bolidensis]MCG7322051.1 glycosyltransferase [Arsenicicoccus bolidensis]